LAGVGFAVLLIPVNRYIAVKIADLSESLMAQKDARVKVCIHSSAFSCCICLLRCLPENLLFISEMYEYTSTLHGEA